MAVKTDTVTGAAIAPWLDELARLRIQVFRDWPYLYDGSEDYERRYLHKYVQSPLGFMVLALADGALVGASSGLPLLQADAEFQRPFVDGPVKPEQIFYFGESVLDPAYRGQGLGHAFFDQREAFARQNGFGYCTFCAVQRPSSHPLRPQAVRDLDTFWRRRGYEKITGAVTGFSWTDIGDEKQSVKPMQFWGKNV